MNFSQHIHIFTYLNNSRQNIYRGEFFNRYAFLQSTCVLLYFIFSFSIATQMLHCVQYVEWQKSGTLLFYTNGRTSRFQIFTGVVIEHMERNVTSVFLSKKTKLWNITEGMIVYNIRRNVDDIKRYLLGAKITKMCTESKSMNNFLIFWSW